MGHSRSASNRRIFTSSFMNWCCASRTAATRTRVSSCRIACATGSPSTGEQGVEEVADWFSAWWCGPVKGRWLLGNGGFGLVANKEGMESSWCWDHNAISGGRQVRRLNKKRGGASGGGERKESAGLAGISSHLHRQHAQEPQGALQAGRLRPRADGSPQRLPLGTKSFSFRLDHNAQLACRDFAPHICLEIRKVQDLETASNWHWINSQGTQEDMRVLVRNLKEQERRVLSTSHAP